ncbi:MAG: MltA domain-containing protein [Bacteriovoracia bacterium]
MKHIIFLLILLLLFSCARAPLKDRKMALRRVGEIPKLRDDLPLETLIQGIKSQIIHLQTHRPKIVDFSFADKKFSVAQYLASLNYLIDLYNKKPDKEFFLKELQENFDFYEVYGRDNYGEVFITSYYEPVLKGSLKPKGKLTQALYKRPSDLVRIELKNFVRSHDYSLRCKDCSKLYGRISEKPSATGLPHIIPHFSRKEIDQGGALQGKDLSLCYVDPLEAFLLHIQGSGTIELEDGTSFRLGFHGQNGRRYISLGKTLTDIIPLEQMNLPRLEEYLRSLTYEELMDVLSRNPSYVFFKKLAGRPVTSLGTEVIDGRTIATDARFFPKGALGFLLFSKPVFKDDKHSITEEFELTGRLVLDQDTGGAIYGGGRVDLFWGRGKEAKRYAGVMKGYGELYYLAPKSSLLAKLFPTKPAIVNK